MTHTRRQLTALLEAHGLAPSRALGQNFLVDPNTVRRIARLADIGPDSRVVEIGAGAGSLTLALVETGARVVAVEVDRGLAELLVDVLEGTGAELVVADARAVDWQTMLGDGDWTLVANLPYNIATPLICDLLDDVPQISRMVVMVQREVAERLVAEPGSRTYGIPSVKVAWWANARIVASIGPDVFVPRPRVDSAIVEIVRREAVPDDVDVGRLFELVTRAFGQRRKMLRRSLSGVVDDGAFARAGIDPEARPETLGTDEWMALARNAGTTVAAHDRPGG